MTRRWLLPLIVLAATACGGGDATAPASNEPEPPLSASPDASPVATEVTEEPSPATGNSEAAVTAENFVFSPATVEVAVGATVTWTNADAATHTVTAGTPDQPQPERFDYRLSSDSPTAEMRFDEAGAVSYFCTIHPTMLGTVNVAA